MEISIFNIGCKGCHKNYYLNDNLNPSKYRQMTTFTVIFNSLRDPFFFVSNIKESYNYLGVWYNIAKRM